SHRLEARDGVGVEGDAAGVGVGRVVQVQNALAGDVVDEQRAANALRVVGLPDVDDVGAILAVNVEGVGGAFHEHVVGARAGEDGGFTAEAGGGEGVADVERVAAAAGLDGEDVDVAVDVADVAGRQARDRERA